MLWNWQPNLWLVMVDSSSQHWWIKNRETTSLVFYVLSTVSSTISPNWWNNTQRYCTFSRILMQTFVVLVSSLQWESLLFSGELSWLLPNHNQYEIMTRKTPYSCSLLNNLSVQLMSQNNAALSTTSKCNYEYIMVIYHKRITFFSANRFWFHQKIYQSSYRMRLMILRRYWSRWITEYCGLSIRNKRREK